jgi:hypothetical protein
MPGYVEGVGLSKASIIGYDEKVRAVRWWIRERDELMVFLMTENHGTRLAFLPPLSSSFRNKITVRINPPSSFMAVAHVHFISLSQNWCSLTAGQPGSYRAVVLQPYGVYLAQVAATKIPTASGPFP